MNTLTNSNVEAAKRAHDDAKDTLNRRRGELIAEVKNVEHVTTARYRGMTNPAPVSNALQRLELAELDVDATREHAQEARRASLSDDDKEARAYFQRLNALIAVHVVGYKLRTENDDVHPWRIVEAGGKLRTVPHYTTEVATIASAEKLLDGPQQVRYGKYLAELFACDFHKIATANPYARACAILNAVGVPPDAVPPTIAS